MSHCQLQLRQTSPQVRPLIQQLVGVTETEKRLLQIGLQLAKEGKLTCRC